MYDNFGYQKLAYYKYIDKSYTEFFVLFVIYVFLREL